MFSGRLFRKWNKTNKLFGQLVNRAKMWRKEAVASPLLQGSGREEYFHHYVE